MLNKASAPTMFGVLVALAAFLAAPPLRAQSAAPAAAPTPAEEAADPDLAAELGPLLGPQDLAPQPASSGAWQRALALRASHQSKPAQRAFEALAAQGGPLADRAMHLAALSALEVGDGERAERLLAQISLRNYADADAVLIERARLLRSRSPSGPKVAAQVEALLAPIFSGTVRADVAQAHLLAGDAQWAARDAAQARAHYRAAWVHHPLSAAADSARQRERLLPPGATPVPLLDLIRRAETLLDAHHTHQAIDELSRLPVAPLCSTGCPGDRNVASLLKAALAELAPNALPAPHLPTPQDVAHPPKDPADPLSCRARFDLGKALRKDRQYGRARLMLAPVVLRCADSELRARAVYLLAQLESLAAKPDAGPLWESLARQFPSSPLADDALVYQALARRSQGDRVGEQQLLRRVVDEFPDADLRNEASFQLFWSMRAQGRGREGLVELDRMAARPDAEGADEERARYWRARTLAQAQPGESEPARAAAREAARADWEWLARTRPLTYYGLLARAELHALDPALAGAVGAEQRAALQSAARFAQAPLHEGPFGRDPHFLAAIQLLRLGLKPDALHELNAVDRGPARAAGPFGREPLTLLADLYARAGDLRTAHTLVRTELTGLLRHPQDPLALRAAGLAYPQAFRDEIARSAKAAGIPPDLLQGLMREESALDPHALSSTGALGLTQLMPGTARAVARRLRVRRYSTPQLLQPALNIRLGGAYLGELYAHFGHNPALALAAYNAGPGAVSGWIKAGPPRGLDELVEEIPLEETRGYVKRCLRSFAAYGFLYGGPASDVSLVLPRPSALGSGGHEGPAGAAQR